MVETLLQGLRQRLARLVEPGADVARAQGLLLGDEVVDAGQNRSVVHQVLPLAGCTVSSRGPSTGQEKQCSISGCFAARSGSPGTRWSLLIVTAEISPPATSRPAAIRVAVW